MRCLTHGHLLIFSISLSVIHSHFLYVLEFDRHELQIYEEVARMPPFQRKTLILIGAQGVGRRSLKNRLIVLNPLLFGTTVPCRFSNYSWSAYLSQSVLISQFSIFNNIV